MTLVIECPHEKHGSAIFVKADTTVESTFNSSFNNIEILRTTLNGLTITSIYKPPNEPFSTACVPTSNEEVLETSIATVPTGATIKPIVMEKQWNNGPKLTI